LLFIYNFNKIMCGSWPNPFGKIPPPPPNAAENGVARRFALLFCYRIYIDYRNIYIPHSQMIPMIPDLAL
jgi:hypothetical protein